jgi:hypothetical protein
VAPERTPPGARRAPEQADVDAELAYSDAATPLDFDRYDEVARAVFRRIAVDRGRRCLVGVASGCLCVAALKATLRRTPLVGPLFHSLVVPLLPSGAGVLLGIAACAYLPEESVALPWKHGRRRASAKLRKPGADKAK